MSDWDAATAEWYAAKYGEYATNRLGLTGLDLAPDACIVDIGCGTGAALRHASAQVTAGRLIGVDPVPRMVELAREASADHPVPIEFRVGGAEAIPVADHIADWVFAFDSFHHWRDVAAGLAEARRVLAPSGRWIVVKDASMPTQADRFRATVEAAGWLVEQTDTLEDGDVCCLRWILRRR